MQVRRYLWVSWLFLGAVLAACSGGSGSSGFDAFPQSENSAIQQALGERRCVAFEALSICPADTAPPVLPTATPTPGVTGTPTMPSPARTATPEGTRSPTPTAPPRTATATPAAARTPRVDTGINDGSILCALVDVSNRCVVVVPFAPDGFPSGTVFRVAVRTVDPPSPWTIGADLTPTGSPSAPAFDGSVSVDKGTDLPAGEVRVQVAVLAFVQPQASSPATVESLADSGADYAFVTSELTLQAPAALRADPQAR